MSVGVVPPDVTGEVGAVASKVRVTWCALDGGAGLGVGRADGAGVGRGVARGGLWAVVKGRALRSKRRWASVEKKSSVRLFR